MRPDLGSSARTNLPAPVGARMTMQPDPQPGLDAMVADLRAKLDEDERLARAAVITAHEGPGAYQPHPELSEWRYVPGGEVEYVSTPEMQAQEYHTPYRVTCDSEGILPAVDESVGPHIARHDPARVLRLVAAHRRLLDDLLAEQHRACAAEPGGHDACSCGRDERVLRRVRLLAAAYADSDGSRRPA